MNDATHFKIHVVQRKTLPTVTTIPPDIPHNLIFSSASLAKVEHLIIRTNCESLNLIIWRFFFIPVEELAENSPVSVASTPYSDIFF